MSKINCAYSESLSYVNAGDSVCSQILTIAVLNSTLINDLFWLVLLSCIITVVKNMSFTIIFQTSK